MRRRHIFVALLGILALAMPNATVAHELDHPAPGFTEDEPVGTGFNSGGQQAEWELVRTIKTGNPHTDLDFFTQGGDMYASVGTLAAGANAAGQTIIQLTENGRVTPESIKFIAGHPSAQCASNPSAALGLQHDVEATPKGNVILNTRGARSLADRSDAQLLLDASDQRGRCHDNGNLALPPRGGIEIIDITDIANPKEIGLISHSGEAHTVNVDPKRPHIAYAVSSDAVSVSVDVKDADGDGNTKELIRENEIDGDNDQVDLDGFEVINLKSCMNFPAGTTIDEKRAQCRPKVFRYRYPTLRMALGHTLKNAVYGCHELELYPNDRLTCGGGNAMIMLDMSGVFNDRGTPNNYTDDTIRGAPMPCRVRDSSSVTTRTGAKVTDCVVGKENIDLRIPNWLKQGKPGRLPGVRHLGSAHHMGRGALGPDELSAYKADEDIDFNHEAELTDSGRFVISTDERGGGVVPPGASCSPGVDNKEGNGGLHAYAVSRLTKKYPSSAREAWKAYARKPNGDKAIFRAPIHTQPQGSTCTAHVMQQVPGQNRIFMGWYTQGTQVIDFVENRNGTFSWKSAGYFIPEQANEWTSHIFKTKENTNGTFTYWGVATDFSLGAVGRNVIDVYKVTLPRPASMGSACTEDYAIRGDNGDNVLVGTPRDDIICGRGGDDRIRGRGGEDIIIGGAGNDAIRGEGAKDIIIGGFGEDTMTGGAGKDLLRGEAGNDIASGGNLHDVVIGGAGRDSVKGNDGRDTLRGSVGGDILQGGYGDDLIYGMDGNDTLKGFDGDDYLSGGPGFDVCFPGRGDDRTRSC